MADDAPVNKGEEAETQTPVPPASFFGDASQEKKVEPAPRRKLGYARPKSQQGGRVAAAVQAIQAPAPVQEPPKQEKPSEPTMHESDDAKSTTAEHGEDDRDALLDSQEPHSQMSTSTVSLTNFPESQDPPGNPNPFNLRKDGAGALVSRLVGVDHPEFQLGSVGGYKHPLQSYEILDTAFKTTPSDTQSAAAASSSAGSEASAPLTPAPYVPDVTPFELASAKPHPDAFFSPKAYGWTIITPWPADSIEPASRLRTAKGACLGGTHIREGKAHFFVGQPKAVDPQHISNLSSNHAYQRSAEDTSTDAKGMLFSCLIESI